MAPVRPANKAPFRAGDIAACFGNNFLSRRISWGTAALIAPRRLRLGPSHVAMMVPRSSNGNRDLLWVESTSLSRIPCLIKQRTVKGVQAHNAPERIDEYRLEGGHVDVYRLSPIYDFCSDERELLEEVFFRHFLNASREIGYDTGGALLSGTRVIKRTALLGAANLDNVFCSELLAAVLMRMNRMNHANPCKYSPGALMRELVRDGTYRWIGSAAVVNGQVHIGA